MEVIWVRMGDCDEYESFDDLESLAKSFEERDLKASELELHGSALMAPGYEGLNFISIFWGNDDAQWCRNLSEKEFEDLKNFIDYPP